MIEEFVIGAACFCFGWQACSWKVGGARMRDAFANGIDIGMRAAERIARDERRRLVERLMSASPLSKTRQCGVSLWLGHYGCEDDCEIDHAAELGLQD